ncbi:diguanylate cyclase regulator RdcB family protein [Anabaena cylindrica UHCC 0172]|uniref:diguanylate cyclase regulator RdcB family protein n=1 Tax=Anabaena cylindrica TaxID=1165 RepID=UPI002B1FAAEA|nr:diguanylate cyclase regulator RdcB family protein [Anabaena cylindrica]MEA5554403.1 diguanylate cyclase regulator RdcB family protein [Anabaena cylindrica UHCC 0172]
MNESFQITTDNNAILDKLTQDHPQLSEKAIVDYINGLEVINDQISFNKQIINSDSFLNKLLDSITGKSQQRQLIINQNVATSLEVISVWLQEVECYRIDNDIVITRLTNKLSETRQGVMRLKGRVSEIDDRLVQLQNKINLEFTKLNERVHRTEAKIHVDLVFTKWKKELWLNYPPIVSLYLSIDELFWGDFGTYCRHSADSKKVNEMREYLRDGVLELIEDKIGIKQHELFDLSELLNPICNLQNEEREMLLYLCDWSDFKTAPVTWSIQSYASSYTPPHVHKEIPKVLNSNRLCDRLIDEQNERAKFNDNH